MMAAHSQQEIVKWIKIFGTFVHNISTLIPTLRVKKPIKVINKNRVHAKRRQAQTSNTNSHPKWSQQLKQK